MIFIVTVHSFASFRWKEKLVSFPLATWYESCVLVLAAKDTASHSALLSYMDYYSAHANSFVTTQIWKLIKLSFARQQ